MIHLKSIFVMLFMVPAIASAEPKKIEMIFLSPQKISATLELMDTLERHKRIVNLAQNEMDKCVPMGDGCFHPQFGYVEKQIEKIPAGNLLEDKKLELKTFNATETSLVNCDKNNYFDIFCGKVKPNGPYADVEVWLDISSSLKVVDYNKDPDRCARRTFIEKVMAICKNKVQVSVYNTAIKEIGDHSSACLAYGTNDQSRLLRWMMDSKARHLLIVTDVDEMSAEIRDFLESNGANITGDGVKAFTSDDLIDYAQEFTKICK